MVMGIDDATIALIGVAVEGVTAAATMGADAIAGIEGNKNLAFSVTVVNGTEYKIVPRWTGFRKGAAAGGVEGTFIKSPMPVDPRGVSSFTCNQIKGATTDVIGAVVYESDVFYWLIGFHSYDQGGIQRYIYSGVFPKRETEYQAINFRELDLWKSHGPLGAKLDFWPNSLIWSGAGPSHSKYSSNGVTQGQGLRIKGEFYRGVNQIDADGKRKLNDAGMPIIAHTKVMGDGVAIEFSSNGVGGGQEMNAVIFDGPSLYHGQPDAVYG